MSGIPCFLAQAWTRRLNRPARRCRWGLVQGLLRAGQLSPPEPEPAALLAKRKVAVKDDTVETIIARLEQFIVVGGEVVKLLHGLKARYLNVPIPIRYERPISKEMGERGHPSW